MVTRAQIVAEALEWEGTPFGHQQATKQVLCDCRGLISGVPQSLGLYPDFVCPEYDRTPNPLEMGRQLRKWLHEIPFRDHREGDVVWFRIRKEPQHLGIIVTLQPLQLLHSTHTRNAVVKHCLDSRWYSLVVACFQYPGLEDQ